MQEFFSPKFLDNITRVEFCGEFVLTSAQIAYALTPKDEFGKPIIKQIVTTQNIKQNFNDNRNRYVEGKHYFRLSGDRLTAFKECVEGLGILQNVKGKSNDRVENFDLVTNKPQNVNLCVENFDVRQADCSENFRPLVGNRANTLYLWTRRGFLHHCKSVNTDVAWQVYEYLEDTYFKYVVGEEKPAEPPPPEDESSIPLIDYRKAFEIAGLTQFCVNPQRFEEFRREISKYLTQCRPPASPKFKSLDTPIKLFYFK